MSPDRLSKRDFAKAWKCWRERRYDDALAEVSRLAAAHPANAQLHVMRSQLIQLQEDDDGGPTLDDARADLEVAAELDEQSPVALIELGHFLSAIDDDAKGASKQFEKAVQRCVDLLTQALVGRVEVLYELGHQAKALSSLMTACSLVAQYPESISEEVRERIKDLMEAALEDEEAPSDGPRSQRRAV